MPTGQSPSPDLRPDATEELTRALETRIMVLDGAMGTAIQRDRPDEAGYRGTRFADWPSDLIGNNDLLTLTQPEIIAGIHREYLEAGADIIETNTFNANSVSLRDYGLEELGYELNFESARLARREADAVAHRRQAPVRRRRARSDHPDRLDLARRQRPRRPQRLLRRARRGVPRGRPRSRRRRLRPADDRDDLRHPQRQGRDLRGRDALRGARPALAGHHLRHHHRRVRAHPVRPGDRGVLGLGAPRPAARRRPQLRARRQGDASVHRRDGPPRRLVRLLLPQRRSAQRVRRVRRGARGDRRDHRRVRRQRVRQHRRRLLRHHARPHRGDRPRGRRQGAPYAGRGRARRCGCPASSR